MRPVYETRSYKTPLAPSEEIEAFPRGGSAAAVDAATNAGAAEKSHGLFDSGDTADDCELRTSNPRVVLLPLPILICLPIFSLSRSSDFLIFDPSLSFVFIGRSLHFTIWTLLYIYITILHSFVSSTSISSGTSSYSLPLLTPMVPMPAANISASRQFSRQISFIFLSLISIIIYNSTVYFSSLFFFLLPLFSHGNKTVSIARCMQEKSTGHGAMKHHTHHQPVSVVNG